MADVEEIIDYLRTLRRGFDKDLFQSKIDELAYAVDSPGLECEDFQTLFKIWVNLYIPIKKWVSLGICLVPKDRVEDPTVEFALRWILTNIEDHSNFSRIAFLLDWLTAAMDSASIDMEALDSGYEVFYSLLGFEVLTINAMKLVYTLTKPSDVTRSKVLQLLDYAKKREAKKNVYNQIQVLLGLFKSYRPECVPEDVPAISIHTSFKKINEELLSRFSKTQESRNISNRQEHLMWVNPLNCGGGRNKLVDALVPNLEFLNVGSQQYAVDKQPEKTYLDFSDPASLLQYSVLHPLARPARLRALLCNEIGLTLLCVASDAEQAFLSHDLYNLLSRCFLEASPHTYVEKQDLLRRLGALQRTLLQGIPVVTRLLAQYLPFWNGSDFFAEILDLVEWINVDSPEYVAYILDPLIKIYHRAQPMEQCAIVKSLSNMYANLVYASTRSHQHFRSARSAQSNYSQMLLHISSSLADMCNKELQVTPEDMRVLHSSIMAAEKMARAEARCGVVLGALPRPLTLALPLVSTSALLIDEMAALLIMYKKIFSNMKAANKHKNQTYIDQCKVLKSYTSDLIKCLYFDEALSSRDSGFIFTKLHPQLVSKLGDLVPDLDTKFNLKNHIAFLPYVYLSSEAVNPSDASNKSCFDTVFRQSFPHLSEVLMKALPELR